ncbi:uncharacterized protein LOC110973398 isoform X2 [Acanthaster planci]|uniref:Uncharacterized protein LOC110973398 isoform X2 n=1 Tax=Acanthaster planci TaxID=133434 RepID=A0A8B7XIF7_ACAPL|nr:uncharacterized protein LOC110973398 isoform X2 [Acanthaster planci]
MDLCTCYKWLAIALLLALLVVRASCQAATGDMVAYLECYRCTAYEFEENFWSKLSQCQSGQVEETVQCPYSITREEQGVDKTHELHPSCTIVEQKAAGVITSYSRGCKYFVNCTEVDMCGESTEATGVCISCCDSDLCNGAPLSVLSRLQVLGTSAAMLVAWMLSR